jgi:hypothetical protein
MQETQQNQTDIAEQKHIGTHPGIVALGYGAVETKFGLLGGAMLGAPIGAIIGDPIVNAERAMQRSLEQSIAKMQGKGFFKGLGRMGLGFANWVVSSSNHVTEWTLKVMPDSIEHSLRGNKRFEAGVAGAAFGAILGFLGTTLVGGKHGWDEANASKKQFRAAQEEIKLLREEKDALLENKAKHSVGLANGEETKPIDTHIVANTAPTAITTAEAEHQGRISRSAALEHSA